MKIPHLIFRILLQEIPYMLHKTFYTGPEKRVKIFYCERRFS